MRGVAVEARNSPDTVTPPPPSLRDTCRGRVHWSPPICCRGITLRVATAGGKTSKVRDASMETGTKSPTFSSDKKSEARPLISLWRRVLYFTIPTQISKEAEEDEEDATCFPFVPSVPPFTFFDASTAGGSLLCLQRESAHGGVPFTVSTPPIPAASSRILCNSLQASDWVHIGAEQTEYFLGRMGGRASSKTSKGGREAGKSQRTSAQLRRSCLQYS
mmetsp:Transcript_44249/g.87299  ORF Transcript_44249/g.87299 Transcript_44249/m.87299 type:complete len:218 (-) Transcript_44249:1295-1948(-)